MVRFIRCLYYLEVDQESGYQNLEKLKEEIYRSSSSTALKKIENLEEGGQNLWPKNGEISIANLYVRYREGLPFVIKGLSLKIQPGEKLGVVGRTGAGKSTLLSCLYKAFEEYQGTIEIDGRELRGVNLKQLRQGISVISQDPQLFQGTLRFNMDPLRKSKDSKIKQALKDVGLWAKIKEKSGLDYPIQKEGSNFSEGELQLLCLAKVLVSDKKIILMDEATANIDPNTEAKIQEVVAQQLGDRTIVTIAHRLDTVLGCDRVMVLDLGEIVEIGPVDVLKEDKTSIFGRMLDKKDRITEYLQ